MSKLVERVSYLFKLIGITNEENMKILLKNQSTGCYKKTGQDLIMLFSIDIFEFFCKLKQNDFLRWQNNEKQL